jgi:hypothetical protein
MPAKIEQRRIDRMFNSMTRGLGPELKLDEGEGGSDPPDKPAFDRNPGGWAIPGWGLFCLGLLIGNVLTALLLFTAVSFVWFLATMVAIAGFASWAAWRRWR